MDKYEYKVRAEEIKTLISEGEFTEAVKIADTIDWHRVKSVMMLCTISDLYKLNRRFQESKDILLMAYERHPGGRLIVYSLCELSIKMGEFVQAIEYYKEFVQIAPKDTGRYILQYKLYEAQDVSLEERIAVLEEFKKRDYRERWAYELAYLYHRVGLETKCVEECDEMVLWFGEGRHVLKALELKMLHEPLNEEQQSKYALLKQERETPVRLQEEEEAYSGGEEQEDQEDQEEQLEEEDTAEDAEEEFFVKTVDVGQYNTINLQKELAESMKSLLSTPENETVEEEEPSSLGAFTQSIVAPLLEETGDMQDAAAALPEEETTLIPEHEPVAVIPEPKSAMEEVFFEDAKDILLEDTKEIDIGRSSHGDTKEIKVKKTIYPMPVKMPATLVPPATPEVQVQPQAPVAGPVQLSFIPGMPRPTGFESILSQEYDGQIKLVVPEKEQVEKQITGQMSITDIMLEWERMKRQNEEKRREDVRRRVQQHTGNLLSDFEEAARDGLLELIEKAAEEEPKKQTPVSAVPPSAVKVQPPAAVELPQVTEVTLEESIETIPEETPREETLSAETVIPEEVSPEPEEKIIKAPVEETQSLVQPELLKELVEDANRLRPLSEEERELFGKFIHSRKAKEQIIAAVDTMSMDSYTDNVIVTGEDAAGTVELAKGLVRMMKLSDSNFNGKVAKISGAILNKKDVGITLSKLADGAVIIEHAQEMSEKTAAELSKALSRENNGLLVIMTGSKDNMNRFLEKNHVLDSNFNARVDIEALGDHALVEYAKQYAEEMEYSIDELGILALHTRIADMQTSDHEVTISEVKELVDDAIYFADKKNPKHFFDILFGKRYDEEDMIILRERDFMHY